MKFPSIKNVASILRELNKVQIPACTCGHDECSGDMDVRLQVMPDGSWQVWNGDSSYDTDSRGFWGCGSIPANGKRFNARDTARQLIEQVKDDYYMDKAS
jgi:hypothetical protein